MSDPFFEGSPFVVGADDEGITLQEDEPTHDGSCRDMVLAENLEISHGLHRDGPETSEGTARAHPLGRNPSDER